MPLVKVKPTSPGRRALVKVVTPELHKGEPYWPLTEQQRRGSGRNNHGRVTMRHQGGGHKHHLRILDFRRNKDGIAAQVERLEYDPNRSAHVALLLYVDGERRYVIAPKGIAVGTQLMSGAEAPIKTGNALPLRNIPVGTIVHCVEMMPGKGAQLARSAGAGVQVLAREDRLRVVDEFVLDAPKTKLLAKKVKDMGFDELLVITDEVDEKLALSSRNLANVAIIPARHANPVALVRSKNVLITKAAVAKLEEMLK